MIVPLRATPVGQASWSGPAAVRVSLRPATTRWNCPRAGL